MVTMCGRLVHQLTVLQATFVGAMRQDPPQHLRWVSWNGVVCVLQGTTVRPELPMKLHAQRAHTGKAFVVFFLSISDIRGRHTVC